MSWLRRVRELYGSLVRISRQERSKLFYLTLTFMLIIGGYTVIRTLKEALFMSIVGRTYIPIARCLSIIMLIPAVLIFSKLVDMVKRYQLFYIYSVIFGIGGMVIALLLNHPTIGLLNTVPNAGRLFGWFIYLFMEGYNPFLVSVFWSFAHSVTGPEESKGNYPIMVAGSKMGGMIAASLGCLVLKLPQYTGTLAREVAAHQILLGVSSLVILLAPLAIVALLAHVPRKYLHGYEAAYQADKAEQQHEKEQAEQAGGFSVWRTLYSMFSGFIFLLKYPYALGMFGIVFFWEIINSFVSYERLAVLQESLAYKTGALLQQDFMIHAGGFLIALFGTRVLVELLGERKSLILVPLITAVLLAFYFTAQSPFSMAVVYVLLRVMNYAFSVPLRERLYTATVKAIKFKSKSWIDSFGVKVAKGVGSGYNMLTMGLSHAAHISVGIAFFSTIIGCWAITASFMGRAFERAVARREVIGKD